jgi:hypothetical protein
LGIIPAYASSLDNVKTTGDFIIAGFAKGLYSDTFLNLMLILNQIMLPSNILIYLNQSKILLLTLKSSTSGILNDTYVNLDKLSFQIDQDVFNAKATIKT